MDWSPLVDALGESLDSVLRQFPDGVDEYRLLKHLEAQGVLPECDMGDSLQLFRRHFLLFHVLYQLRHRLWQGQCGHLEIDALNIRLRPYQAGQEGMQLHDAMADYYLDLGHLAETGAEEVEALLTSFWTRYHASDEVSDALAVMGLEPPCDFSVVQQCYRRLAMRHHPDRGGDAESLQVINRAMEVLRRYYRPTNSDV